VHATGVLGIYSFKLNNLKNGIPLLNLFDSTPSKSKTAAGSGFIRRFVLNLILMYYTDVFLVYISQSDKSINTVVQKTSIDPISARSVN